jgi:hypothetical protein
MKWDAVLLLQGIAMVAFYSCAAEVEPGSEQGPLTEDSGSPQGRQDSGTPVQDAGTVNPDSGTHPEDAGAADAGDHCEPALTPSSDSHPPDYDCMSSGCHGPDTAVAGLLITVSGTLHSTGNGGAPIGGASILVTDSEGKTLHLVTSATGIFWSGVSDGGSVAAGPQGTCASGNCTDYAAPGAMASVIASLCPGVPQACASPTNGECADCHTAGQASQKSVYLP